MKALLDAGAECCERYAAICERALDIRAPVIELPDNVRDLVRVESGGSHCRAIATKIWYGPGVLTKLR